MTEPATVPLVTPAPTSGKARAGKIVPYITGAIAGVVPNALYDQAREVAQSLGISKAWGLVILVILSAVTVAGLNVAVQRLTVKKITVRDAIGPLALFVIVLAAVFGNRVFSRGRGDYDDATARQNLSNSLENLIRADAGSSPLDDTKITTLQVSVYVTGTTAIVEHEVVGEPAAANLAGGVPTPIRFRYGTDGGMIDLLEFRRYIRFERFDTPSGIPEPVSIEIQSVENELGRNNITFATSGYPAETAFGREIHYKRTMCWPGSVWRNREEAVVLDLDQYGGLAAPCVDVRFYATMKADVRVSALALDQDGRLVQPTPEFRSSPASLLDANGALPAKLIEGNAELKRFQEQHGPILTAHGFCLASKPEQRHFAVYYKKRTSSH